MHRVGDDPHAVTQALVDAGYTHVWINFGELDRLRATYGYDGMLTREFFERLINADWRLVAAPHPSTQLYELPR